jgi:hypothetical protein
MARFLAVAATLVLVSGCKKEKSEGLPPAQEWSADTAALPTAPGAAKGANPHAGMGMGAGNNPHAGMGMGGNPHGADPHAGLDMGSPHGQNPHGAGGPNVGQMGLPAPDPNRKIDPNRRLSGTIKVHAKAKDRVPAGGAIFLTVKAVGPDGGPFGPPLAVEKLIWQKDKLDFTLTEAQSMIAGTELKGNVIITARYDQDSDAMSKQPGDVVGTAQATVPADNVSVLLADILQ